MNMQLSGLVPFLLRACLACGGIFFASVPPALASHSVSLPWPELDTVKALLRAEVAAVSGACDWDSACIRPNSGAGQGSKAKPIDKIYVDAIYGLGKVLRVELSVNGNKARYLEGRQQAEYGPDAKDGAYALLAIEGACVRLKRAEQVRRVCLGGPRP